jgi:hypothetical protein
MDQIRLGGSGLHVSRVCLGMMSYGNDSDRYTRRELADERETRLRRAPRGVASPSSARDAASRATMPAATLGHADGGVLALKTYIHPKVRAVDFVDDVLAGRADTNADTTRPARG